MNRRALLKGLPRLITVPAVLKVGADASVPVSSGKATITTAEAFAQLANALNTDEGYRQAWIANIALLLNDCAVLEPEHTRQLREELGMTPHRVIDPRNLSDCNYFAERLLQHITGRAHFVDAACVAQRECCQQ